MGGNAEAPLLMLHRTNYAAGTIWPVLKGSTRAWLPCSAKPDRSWWPAKLSRISPPRDTAVRATIHIECTPAEARLFLGLPDVQPIQAAALDQL